MSELCRGVISRHVIVCIEQEPSLSAMQLIVGFRNTVHKHYIYNIAMPRYDLNILGYRKQVSFFNEAELKVIVIMNLAQNRDHESTSRAMTSRSDLT